MGKSGFRSVLMAGLIIVPILVLITLYSKTEEIEKDLAERALFALSENHAWARVDIDGRDLKLSGIAPTPKDREEAIALLEGVAFDRETGTWGVRYVDASGVKDLPVKTPYKMSATRSVDELTLEGFVPRERVRRTLLSKAKETLPGVVLNDGLILGGGAPSVFATNAELLLGFAAKLAEGRVEIIDDVINLKGLAASVEDYRSLQQSFESDTVLNELKVGSFELTPPAVSPYLIEATRSEKGWELAGFLPDDAAIDDILNEAGKIGLGAANSVTVLPASGGSDKLSQRTVFLLETLEKMEEGSVTLSDDLVSVTGVGKSVEKYRALRTAFSETLPHGLKNGLVEISPPSVSPFVFGVEKSDTGIILDGYVSDDETGSSLVTHTQSIEPELSVSSALIPASGGHGTNTDRARFVIDLLPNIVSGRIDITADTLNVSGQAKSEDDADVLNTLLNGSLPFGIVAGSHEISIPEVAAVSVPEPEVSIPEEEVLKEQQTAGEQQPETEVVEESIPSLNPPSEPEGQENPLPVPEPQPEQDRANALASAPEPISRPDEDEGEQTVLTPPEELVAEEPQSSGNESPETRKETSETSESITIEAENVAEESVVEQVEVPLPVPPPLVAPVPEPEPEPLRISPYIFSVQKNLGRITVEGFLPPDDVASNIKKSIEAMLGDRVTYETAEAIGEPDHFQSAITYGAHLISHLKSGKLEISDQEIGLLGTAKSLEKFDEFTALTEAVPNGFKIVKNAVKLPRITPYALKISRTKQGVTLKGAAPDAANISEIETLAKRWFGKNLTASNLVRGSGEPDGFDQAIKAGIAAVSRFTDGVFSLSDNKIELSGTAPFGAPVEDIRSTFLSSIPGGFEISQSILEAAPPKPRIPERCTEEILGASSRNDVYFNTGKAAILAESFGLLDEIVELALSCPTAHFMIAGHTDSDGSEIFNLQLSKARAISVMNYLIQSGVEGNRLNSIGFGEEKPVVDNDSKENKALNRRIEFSLEKVE